MKSSKIDYSDYLGKYISLSKEDLIKLHDLNLSSYNQLIDFYQMLNTNGYSKDVLSQFLSLETLNTLTENIKEQKSIYNKLRKHVFSEILAENYLFPSGLTYKSIEKLFWGVLDKYYEKKKRSLNDNPKKSRSLPKLAKKKEEIKAFLNITFRFLEVLNAKKGIVVEMCSGRGYLSIFLALAYPDIEFVLFDNSKQTNKRYTSLVNILRNSKNCKLTNITHYIRDIQYDIPELEAIRPDLLLGLHTCGSAADNIIQFGIDKKIPFFVVPCCHHLRNEINGFQNDLIKHLLGVKNLGEEVVRKNFRNLGFKIDFSIYEQHFLIGKFQNIVRSLDRCERLWPNGIGVIEFIVRDITPENMMLFYLPKNLINPSIN